MVAALLSTTPRPDLGRLRMIWHLHVDGMDIFRARGRSWTRHAESPVAVAESTAAAEVGRAARIVASRCGGAYSIVTLSGGILT